ncbi:hypothetical protein ACFVVM_32540 [Nocardia sp. NPDC058176]|uniref:hypothetical protein n=1 Tax=Nocardia sp. NPDC058176 TaxID=3346368 RepID=UPI0036D876CB
MSYPLRELPDLSSLGGTWTTVTVADCAFGHPVQVGRANFPDHEWPYEPGENTWRLDSASLDGYPLDGLDEIPTAWYLEGDLLLCLGCGTDVT